MSVLRLCAHRSLPRSALNTAVISRGAHKKASIQVRLNEYVEGLGIKDEIVTIRPGLMRNVLYPAGKASYIQHYQGPRNRALEARQKLEAEQSQADRSAGINKRRAMASQLRRELGEVQVLEFKRAVIPETTNTFGSVTAEDLTSKLKEEYGLTIDKQLIEFKTEGGRIKSLGDHDVLVQIVGSSTPVPLKVRVVAA